MNTHNLSIIRKQSLQLRYTRGKYKTKNSKKERVNHTRTKAWGGKATRMELKKLTILESQDLV